VPDVDVEHSAYQTLGTRQGEKHYNLINFEVAVKIFYVYAIWAIVHVLGAWYTISSHPLVPSDSLSYHGLNGT